MKIILISIGTRGDIEPFLAIGELLQEKGHQAICAFPDQFRNLAEESNLQFVSLGLKFIELLQSNDGKLAMGGRGSGLEKFLATIRLARNQTDASKELLNRQYELVEKEKPDRIIYNGKAVYPIIWSLSHFGKTIWISPLPYMHYVRDRTHLAFNSNYGPFLNKLTYSLANFGLVTTVMIAKKWLGITRKITREQVQDALVSNKAIYTISSSLFSRPVYWHKNLKVLGFHQRRKTINWEPDGPLIDFLEKHNKILFITFGSMTNPESEEKTKIVIEILERNHIPAIINTESGGLVKPVGFVSELIYFVSRVPYDWIFPRIYGTIHHGGSGTTHLSLKYGCATMIIPHILDQFVWNKILFDKGVGPKGIKIEKISTKSLEPKVLELINNISFKKTAEQIANHMEKEDFREEIYKAIVEA
ncbi:glycosyl transferase [Rubidibacter lacunae KORDI 51-2]|uniref:Glycosyl transferase n=1 Tax=Rubidibacter lacunae KORDI 51-2 TaxID=582515 RepID=U5DQE4_9CHRO|nr:glycosyltransferase [Rubidibacter lacunae]ERN41910.1 glycosyl transferase [Rubidibacter lacunae KORDI 51-2]